QRRRRGDLGCEFWQECLLEANWIGRSLRDIQPRRSTPGHRPTGRRGPTLPRLEEPGRPGKLYVMRGLLAVNDRAISPDGRWLVGCGEACFVQLWDLTRSHDPIQLRHDAGVRSVSFSSNSEYLATAGQDGKVRIWDLTLAPLTLAPKRKELMPLVLPL